MLVVYILCDVVALLFFVVLLCVCDGCVCWSPSLLFGYVTVCGRIVAASVCSVGDDVVVADGVV